MHESNTRATLLRVPSPMGLDSKGVAFGLEGNLYLPVVGALLVSILLLTLLINAKSLPIVTALVVAALPFVLTLAFVLAFVQGKPPHALRDGFARLSGEGGFVYQPQRQPDHPLRRALAKVS